MPNSTAVLAFVLAFGFTEQSGTTPGSGVTSPRKTGRRSGRHACQLFECSGRNRTCRHALTHCGYRWPIDALFLPATSLSRQRGTDWAVCVDRTMAVNLINGRWGSIQIPAGRHVIKPKDDETGIEIDAEPGQSYYFRSGWGERECSTALIKTA
jgi:hypothetical protein